MNSGLLNVFLCLFLQLVLTLADSVDRILRDGSYPTLESWLW